VIASPEKHIFASELE